MFAFTFTQRFVHRTSLQLNRTTYSVIHIGHNRNLVGLGQFDDMCSLRQPSRALPPQAESRKKVQNEIHVGGEESYCFCLDVSTYDK